MVWPSAQLGFIVAIASLPFAHMLVPLNLVLAVHAFVIVGVRTVVVVFASVAVAVFEAIECVSRS